MNLAAVRPAFSGPLYYERASLSCGLGGAVGDRAALVPAAQVLGRRFVYGSGNHDGSALLEGGAQWGWPARPGSD